jgi:hypothetical protein
MGPLLRRQFNTIWQDSGKRLEVETSGETSFNDRAPLAPVRRAITAVPTGTTSCYPTIGNSVSRPGPRKSEMDVPFR